MGTFNDVAVAIEILKTKGMKRAAVIDLDVHHGNGTAFIFNGRSPSDEVFTFSMHQQHNYPMWKPASSLDIGLADGVHDETYLETGQLELLHAVDECLPFGHRRELCVEGQQAGLARANAFERRREIA